jgi:hypothetical protein
MTDEQHRDTTGEFIEKRQEERFRVPPVYERYITLQVKSGDEFVRCILGDFSRSGVLFISPVAFQDDSHAECVISMPILLSKEVAFGIRVKYCLAREGAFFVGAAIDTVADQIRFEIFSEIHDFIVQRQDEVY